MKVKIVSKRNDDFFKAKKPWSETKDALLGCYLKPYFAKIKNLKKPICYIDGFAGKGKFDDGKDGSPRIALKALDHSFENFNTSTKPIVNSYFIDVNYADDLRENLSDFNQYNVHIIDGTFEKYIEKILSQNQNCSIFLYIDPYGIKALNADNLIYYAGRFKSIELLINFNSYGFFRDACRILNVKIKDKTIDNIVENLEEYDNTPIDSEDTLTKIIGTNHWVNTILKYKEGNINGGEAETEISYFFCNRLKNGYKYVLNMPIRRKDELGTKYRLVHCCNHPDGCVLMADNMYKRSLEHRDERHGGQLSFLEFTVDDKAIDDSEIEKKLKFEIPENNMHLNNILANFYTNNGVLCDVKKLISFLKNFEKNGEIIVIRYPDITKKGTPRSFWSEKNGTKGQTLLIKKEVSDENDREKVTSL